MTFRERFAAFQRNPAVHPMTCGRKSSHPPLVLDDDESTMRCPEPGCGYVQDLGERLREIVEEMHDARSPFDAQADVSLDALLATISSREWERETLAEWGKVDSEGWGANYGYGGADADELLAIAVGRVFRAAGREMPLHPGDAPAVAPRTLRVSIVSILAGPTLAVTDTDGRGAALPIREELAQRLQEEHPGAYDFMGSTWELTIDGVFVVEARKVEG